MPVTREMRWWIQIDEELVGALDANGFFHNPIATIEILRRYGVDDEDEQRTAREVLRYFGIGRAEATFEED